MITFPETREFSWDFRSACLLSFASRSKRSFKTDRALLYPSATCGKASMIFQSVKKTIIGDTLVLSIDSEYSPH